MSLVAAICAAAPLVAQESEAERLQRRIEDRVAVLETVREMLEALGSRNTSRLEALHLPQALTISVRTGGEAEFPRVLTLPELLESIADVTVPLRERIWDPEVRVDGDVASVWTPYDFYVDGEFSHCGHDAFHLIRVGDDWRIAAASYTVAQPPDCRTHPEGPPAGVSDPR
jgi:hypothetical protein